MPDRLAGLGYEALVIFGAALVIADKEAGAPLRRMARALLPIALAEALLGCYFCLAFWISVVARSVEAFVRGPHVEDFFAPLAIASLVYVVDRWLRLAELRIHALGDRPHDDDDRR